MQSSNPTPQLQLLLPLPTAAVAETAQTSNVQVRRINQVFKERFGSARNQKDCKNVVRDWRTAAVIQCRSLLKG